MQGSLLSAASKEVGSDWCKFNTSRGVKLPRPGRRHIATRRLRVTMGSHYKSVLPSSQSTLRDVDRSVKISVNFVPTVPTFKVIAIAELWVRVTTLSACD